jgi:hypothetical protein
LRRDEPLHLRLRVDPPQFRQDIGVKEPADHKRTSRTGMAPRTGSISRSRNGED